MSLLLAQSGPSVTEFRCPLLGVKRTFGLRRKMEVEPGRHEFMAGQFTGPAEAPDPAAVKKAAEMLLAAKQPLLWAGQGVHYAEASEQLAALAELLPAPVVATNPGKSAIAD